MTIEHRTTNARPVKLETRDGEAPRLVGYAAVFHREDDPGTEFELFEGATERIAPEAFRAALEEGQDARGLFNHDSNAVLGRVSAKTLRLSTDEVGLRYELDLPDTSTGRDVAELIRRGDIAGSSFGFVARRADWTEGEGRSVRTLRQVDLVDVGPVTYPAYASTTTGVRSQDTAREELEAHKAALEATQKEKDARAHRAGQVEKDLRVDALKFSA